MWQRKIQTAWHRETATVWDGVFWCTRKLEDTLGEILWKHVSECCPWLTCLRVTGELFTKADAKSAKDLLKQRHFNKWPCWVCWYCMKSHTEEMKMVGGRIGRSQLQLYPEFKVTYGYRLLTTETLSQMTRQNQTRCPSFMTPKYIEVCWHIDVCQPGNCCRVTEELGFS